MKILSVILTALFLSACGDYPTTDVSGHPSTVYDTSGGWYDEFMLKDGTKCVAHHRGGITCNWRN